MDCPFSIAVYDKSLRFRNQIPDPNSVRFIPRYNDIGSVEVEIPLDHFAVPDLVAEGARLVVTYKGETISGWISQIDGGNSSLDGMLKVTVSSDYALVNEMLAWPKPGADLDEQDAAYDVRSGPVETVLKGYAVANQSRFPYLSVAADQGRGGQMTGSARMNTLAELCIPATQAAEEGSAQVRIGYGNLYAGRTLTDRGWQERIDPTVALIESLGVDLFFPVEFHEENDMHKYLMDPLKAANPEWALGFGGKGNHLIYRQDMYFLEKAKTRQMPANRSMTDFTIRHIESSVVFHVINTHFIANGGRDRHKERLQQASFVASYAASIPQCVIVGDINSYTEHKDWPRGQFAKVGFAGMKTRSFPTNAGKNSFDGKKQGRWIEDIWTRSAQNISNTGMVNTGGASDHYGWMRGTVSFGTSARSSLGVSVTQKDVNGAQKLVLDVYEPRVYLTPLSEEGGTVLSWSWSRSSPATTAAIVMGSGDLEDRQFTEVTDGNTQQLWGRRIEAAVDARDVKLDLASSDLNTGWKVNDAYRARGLETLGEGGAKVGLSVELAEAGAFAYGGTTGVRVGDTVSLEVGVFSLTDVLTEAPISWGSDGFKAAPTIGDKQDSPALALNRAVDKLSRSVDQLKTRK